jgi:hypothetical protein
LRTTNRGHPDWVRAVYEGVTLDNPEEFLYRVVEVELDLVGGRGDGFRTCVLHLLDEVLVALLSKTTTLLRIEVYVVNIERGSGEGLRSSSRRCSCGGLIVLRVLPCLEVNVDAHFVVLESDEGDCNTRVTTEPELERNVESLGGGTLTGNTGDGCLGR